MIQRVILDLKPSRLKNTTNFTYQYLLEAAYTTHTSVLHGLMPFFSDLHLQPSPAVNSNMSLSLPTYLLALFATYVTAEPSLGGQADL
jgi:hypothetical protein